MPPARLKAHRYRGALRPHCHLFLQLFLYCPAAGHNPCLKGYLTGSRQTPVAQLLLQIQ